MALSVRILGQRLQEAREAKGVTQEQLAEASEMTPSHLSKIERGAKQLTVVRLAQICDALDIDIGVIIGAADTPTNAEFNKQFGIIAKRCSPDTVHAMLDVCARIAAVEEASKNNA